MIFFLNSFGWKKIADYVTIAQAALLIELLHGIFKHDLLTWFNFLSDGQNMFRDFKFQNLAILWGAISSWIKGLETNEEYHWILHIVKTSGKLWILNFLDLQNFPRATHMTNKWPQSNKLFSLRNQSSCTKITRGFPFLGCKKQSLHFSLCGQLLCIICFEAKLSPLEQFVIYPLTTFFGRSSNFQTSVLMFNHNCSTWFLFGTPTLRLMFEP